MLDNKQISSTPDYQREERDARQTIEEEVFAEVVKTLLFYGVHGKDCYPCAHLILDICEDLRLTR
mgnify:CR=1 FL=1